VEVFSQISTLHIKIQSKAPGKTTTRAPL